jgi:hypothetical protein
VFVSQYAPPWALISGKHQLTYHSATALDALDNLKGKLKSIFKKKPKKEADAAAAPTSTAAAPATEPTKTEAPAAAPASKIECRKL